MAEIETPIIALGHKIVMRVNNGENLVFEQDIVNQMKITVPRKNIVINDDTTLHNNIEYQTCFTIEQENPEPNSESASNVGNE